MTEKTDRNALTPADIDLLRWIVRSERFFSLTFDQADRLLKAGLIVRTHWGYGARLHAVDFLRDNYPVVEKGPVSDGTFLTTIRVSTPEGAGLLVEPIHQQAIDVCVELLKSEIWAYYCEDRISKKWYYYYKCEWCEDTAPTAAEIKHTPECLIAKTKEIVTQARAKGLIKDVAIE